MEWRKCTLQGDQTALDDSAAKDINFSMATDQVGWHTTMLLSLLPSILELLFMMMAAPRTVAEHSASCYLADNVSALLSLDELVLL